MELDSLEAYWDKESRKYLNFSIETCSIDERVFEVEFENERNEKNLENFKFITMVASALGIIGL